jgi:LPS-assembly lipoprotein
MRFRAAYQRYLWLGLLLLTGCGFHLRGTLDMPPWLNHVAIIINQGNRDLEPLLRTQFEAFHIEVSEEPRGAQYLLIIEGDELDQQITSISSSTTPRQYELTYRVRFKLQRAHAEDIIPTSTVSVSRQLTINSDRILGSNNESAITEQEMRRDAVMRICDRIGKHVE